MYCDALLGPDVLGPDIRLQTQDVLPMLRGQ